MDKKKFQLPELEVIKFDEKDVITASIYGTNNIFDINDVNGLKDDKVGN